MPPQMETEQVALNRRPTWDGLGTTLKTDMNWDEVVEAVPSLGSVIVKKPVFVDSHQVSGIAATVRESDGKILGIVGENYSVHQTEEAFALLRSLQVEGDICFESAGTLHEGKILWILARVLGDLSILGDQVSPYLLFSTSFDGSCYTQCAFSPTRDICSNLLSLSIKSNLGGRIVKIRHSGENGFRFKEAAKLLGLHSNYIAHLNVEAEVMAKIPFGEERFRGLVDLLIPNVNEVATRASTMADRRSSLLWMAIGQSDLADIRQNGWGAYNAVADWLQHSPPGRASTTWQEARFLQTVSGSPLLETARQFILASA